MEASVGEVRQPTLWITIFTFPPRRQVALKRIVGPRPWVPTAPIVLLVLLRPKVVHLRDAGKGRPRQQREPLSLLPLLRSRLRIGKPYFQSTRIHGAQVSSSPSLSGRHART